MYSPPCSFIGNCWYINKIPKEGLKMMKKMTKNITMFFVAIEKKTFQPMVNKMVKSIGRNKYFNK